MDPQPDRFDPGTFLVYDTQQRYDIRNQLWQLARDASELGGRAAYVTGVGGNGKSHNLALFVKQARDAGALVAYVHDAEAFVSVPGNLFEAVMFGLGQLPQSIKSRLDQRLLAEFAALPKFVDPGQAKLVELFMSCRTA